MLVAATKQLLSMAIPMMSTRLVQMLTTFISMLVLAQLGHTVLAASFTIGMYRIVILLIFFSILFVLGSIVGRQFMGGDKESLSPMLWQSWVLALLISVPIIILYLLAGPLMILFKQPANVIPYISTYFYVFLFSVPCSMIAGVNNQFLAGLKKQKYVTYISICVLLISTFFNIVLVFGYLGFPKWGVPGSAFASIIVSIFSAGVSGFFLIKFMPCKLRAIDIKGMKWAKMITKIGLPVSFQTSSEMIGLLIIAVITGWFGETAMGASQISNEYMMLVLVPIFGLSEANSIVVSHAVGEKKHEITNQIATAGVILSTIAVVFVGIIFAIFHRPLADIFLNFDKGDATAIYHLAITLLAIRIVRMLFDGATMVYTGSLRGLFDTKFAMWLSILTQWIIIVPLMLVLALWLNMGVIGIAIASVISRVIAAIALHWRWKQKMKCLN